VGDVDDLERVIERDGDRLYRLALRITGRHDDAEAAIQSALRAVAGAPHTLDADSPLSARIYRAVARAAHRTRRERSPHAQDIAVERVIPRLDRDGHFEPMDDWSSRIGERAIDDRLGDVVMDAIDALPVDDRTALILHDLEGASAADVASILGADVSTIKTRVHRGRLVVRKRLAEYFESAGVAEG
jgi:RNA polymerase sigma-70 factor (ECF subfamily)